MFETVLILFVILIITAYIQSRKANPKKILNVYSQPGKWYSLKYVIFTLSLWARRLFHPKPIMKTLETMMNLSSHEKAFDAVFFHATSKDGWFLCGGVERRHWAKANALLYLVHPKMGLLESEHLPNTLLDSEPSSLLTYKEYSAGGISFEPIEPMKKWKLTYRGKMRLQKNPDKLVDVQLQGEWTSDLPHFLFETDADLKSIARAVAREEWTKEFFESLKSAHQTHYEHMGHLVGTITIDNQSHSIQMDSFRDHSFGHKRDWALMHRYIFHMFYLEDGTRVSVGVVSQPVTTSFLEMGYVILPDKCLHPIRSCNLLLYQHGENGRPNETYAFSFQTDEQIYDVRIKVLFESVHYKGNNVEAKMIERFVECQVNGIKGKGVSEWHYNNTKKY